MVGKCSFLKSDINSRYDDGDGFYDEDAVEDYDL